MERIIYLSWLPILVASVLAGYGLGPSASVLAQPPEDPVHPLGIMDVSCPDAEGSCEDQSADPFRNRETGEHMPAEFHTTTPPPIPGAGFGRRSQKYLESMYWAIDDIRNAHQVLVDAELAGRLNQVDPNAALHDFPLWSRTMGWFVEHTPQNPTGPTAEQSMGVSQFIVFMGGTGTVLAGGEITDAVTLTENGRQIWGELRGNTIRGGETFQVKEGDFMTIPANQPAQFTATSSGGLTYMAMKVNAQMYPWELIR